MYHGLCDDLARVVHIYELSIPILMVIWLGEFRVGTVILGITVTVGYGLFSIGVLPAGILVDRFGSRELVLICLAGIGWRVPPVEHGTRNRDDHDRPLCLGNRRNRLLSGRLLPDLNRHQTAWH